MKSGCRSPKPRTHYPCCVGGDGNCPPEDCGGSCPAAWCSWRH
ncbi:IS1096 element passenger TnpR family protein [Mesorhizobium australicum]